MGFMKKLNKKIDDEIEFGLKAKKKLNMKADKKIDLLKAKIKDKALKFRR